MYPGLYGYDDTSNSVNVETEEQEMLLADEKVIEQSGNKTNSRQLFAAVLLMVGMVIFFGT